MNSLSDTKKLLATGVIAGFASGLLGVGGGMVIVPFLVLFLHFQAKRAIATSLATIAPIALVGAVLHAGYGNVHFQKALIVGVPAIAGVLVGFQLQQYLSGRTLKLIFAALLLLVALDLLLPWV